MPKQLQPHQQRVVNEKTELDDNLTKLQAFFSTDIFKGLPEIDKGLLSRQAVIMRQYSNVLEERINLFK